MALLFVGVALGIGLLLERWVGYRFPLIFFAGAALTAAWKGGLGPGVLAMLLGFLGGDYFFVPPLYRFGSYNASDYALLLTYCAVTMIGLAAISNLHQARRHETEVKHWNKELERRVRERTAELEAFSYSISHDLRAPIRAISSFAELLKEDHAAQLDEEGRNMLGTVVDSAKNMDRLLNDLLRLARISRKPLQHRTVNLSLIAETIACDLQKAAPQRKVTITVAPNLKAQGDEGLLRIALDNLFSNAWKFTAKKPDARIRFSLETLESRQAFCVSDNGIGFEMKKAKKIFGVFERLEPSDDFPGTGIGLAIVQRVISRHGGQVWVRAAPNEGAAFYFALPG